MLKYFNMIDYKSHIVSHQISTDWLEKKALQQLALQGHHLVLSDAVTCRINQCRQYLDAKMNTPNTLYYGINTGFGFLQNIASPDFQIQTSAKFPDRFLL